MRIILLTVVALMLASCCTLKEEKTAKIVFLHGSRSHASGDHEFKAGSHLLANHLNKQKAVAVKAVVHEGWPKDESILDDADAIVIYADGTSVIRHGWDKVDALVKERGIGLFFMHYAVHPGIAEGEKYFTPWIGGYFRNQHSVNPFWLADIKVNKDHQTSKGVGEIKAIDEFYHTLKYHENIVPLGTATPTEKNLLRVNNLWTKAGYMSKNLKQHLLWGIVREDGSRGGGFTGGHHHNNWALTNYRKLVLNSIVWVAGKEVPDGGVPTAEVSEDELNENLDDYGDKTRRIKLPTRHTVSFTPGKWMTPEEHAEKRKRRRKK